MEDTAWVWEEWEWQSDIGTGFIYKALKIINWPAWHLEDCVGEEQSCGTGQGHYYGEQIYD